MQTKEKKKKDKNYPLKNRYPSPPLSLMLEIVGFCLRAKGSVISLSSLDVIFTFNGSLFANQAR